MAGKDINNAIELGMELFSMPVSAIVGYETALEADIISDKGNMMSQD